MGPGVGTTRSSFSPACASSDANSSAVRSRPHSSKLSMTTSSSLPGFGTPGGAKNKALLLGLVIPLALVANTIRIAVLLMVANAWGTDAAMDYYHDYSSYVFFALALGLLVLVSGGLRCPLWRLQFDPRPS